MRWAYATVGVLVLSCHAAACGGDAVSSIPGGAGGSGGTDGTGGGRPDGGEDGCDGLVGDYVVELAPSHSSTPEQDTTLFTIHLAGNGVGCEGTLTPAYYPSVVLPAEVTAQAVRFDDSAGPELPTLTVGWYAGLHFFSEYHFQRVELVRGADGGLTGRATARVQVQWAEDDICSVNEVDYEGTVEADSARPAVLVGPQPIEAPKRPGDSCFFPTGGEARPGLPEDDLLPWDVVSVRASEPVAGLSAHLTIVDAASPAGPATGTFEDAELSAGVVAKDTWAWARFTDWDAVRGTTQAVSVRAGLSDAAGNPLESASVSLTVLDVGGEVGSHEFDGAPGAVGMFGDVVIAGGTATIRAPCNSGTGGIAGILSTAGATRVLARVQPDSGSGVRFTVYGASGAEYVPETWAEPGPDGWAEVLVEIGQEPRVGFTLSPSSACHWTSSAALVVDRVWSE